MASTATVKKRPLSRADRARLEKVKAAVRETLPDADLILYGSRARGDAREESDWDLLALTDQPVTRQIEFAVWDRVYEEELAATLVFSVLVENRREWAECPSPLRDNISREGLQV